MAIGTSNGEHFEDEFDMHHQQLFGSAEDKKDFTDKFNTPLSPEEQQIFNEKFGNNPRDMYDYDLQGFHKANPDFNREEGQHLTDQFKKPNHPTFSDESQYHGGEFEGGHWTGGLEGRFGFTPGKTNLEMHGQKGLSDYFKKSEPGNVLNPSGEDHKIILARHGKTAENEEDVVRTKDAQLTDEGRKQADTTARQLKSEGVNALASSSLDRAKEYAHLVSAKLGIVPQFDPRLDTWDVGSLEGKPCSEGDPEMKRLAEKAQDEPAPGGGESFNEFKDRAFAGIRDAVNNNQGKKLAILTHSKVEGALKAWNDTGQDNPSLNYKLVNAKADPPGSVEPFTLKDDSTIMQGDTFSERFQGQGDLKGDILNQMDFMPTPAPNLKAPLSWTKSKTPEEEFGVERAFDPDKRENLTGNLYQRMSEKLPGIPGPLGAITGLITQAGKLYQDVTESNEDYLRRKGIIPQKEDETVQEKFLRLLHEGKLSNREIAKEVGLSVEAVKRHRDTFNYTPEPPRTHIAKGLTSKESDEVILKQMEDKLNLSDWMKNQFEGGPVEPENNVIQFPQRALNDNKKLTFKEWADMWSHFMKNPKPKSIQDRVNDFVKDNPEYRQHPFGWTKEQVQSLTHEEYLKGMQEGFGEPPDK